MVNSEEFGLYSIQMKGLCTLCFVLLLTPFSPLAAQEAAPVLTLAQSLDAALSQGDGSRIIEKTLQQARALYSQTVADNSLALSGSLGYGAAKGYGDNTLLSSYSGTTGTNTTTYVPQSLKGGFALTGPSTNLSVSASQSIATNPSLYNQSIVGVSLSQKVWDGYFGGISRGAVDKSLINLQSTELGGELNKLGLLYQVKQAYYTALAAQRNIAVYRQNIEKQKAALEQTTALYGIQQASSVDLQTAQINAKSAEIDLRSGTNDYRNAKKNLANLIGRPADQDFTLAENEATVLPVQTLSEAIATGLGKRIELRQIELNRKTAAINLDLARAKTSATVTVSGGSYLLLNPVLSTDAHTINAGVTVGLPVYDAGSAKYQIEQSIEQQETYDLQASQSRKSIGLAIEIAYEAVQVQKEKLDLAQLSAENSEAQYQLKQAQRQYGTATNQDVLTAAVAAANAEIAYAKARSDLDLSVLSLQNAMGF
jgi:outer membrane protein